MAEIPSSIWMALGAIIGIISLYIGFIRPIDRNAFFQLMAFIGLAMTIFGYLKRRFQNRNESKARSHQRLHRGVRDVSIDIDDYRNNPQLKQQVMQGGHGRSTNQDSAQNVHTAQQSQNTHAHTSQGSHQAQAVHHQTNQQVHQPAQHSQKVHHPVHAQGHQPQHASQKVNPHSAQTKPGAKFCGECGSPLLKKHKYCPICGIRC